MPKVSKVQIQLDNYTPIIQQAMVGSKSFPLSDSNRPFLTPPYWAIYENLYYKYDRFKLGEYKPSDTTLWNAFHKLGDKLNEYVNTNRQTDTSTKSGLATTKPSQGF